MAGGPKEIEPSYYSTDYLKKPTYKYRVKKPGISIENVCDDLDKTLITTFSALEEWRQENPPGLYSAVSEAGQYFLQVSLNTSPDSISITVKTLGESLVGPNGTVEYYYDPYSLTSISQMRRATCGVAYYPKGDSPVMLKAMKSQVFEVFFLILVPGIQSKPK